MSYLVLRHIHIAAAAITIALFTLRGLLALAGVDWRRWRPLRWLPHLNDTVLLVAAVSLAAISAQYPFQQPWLTAKVLALLAYIGFGKLALRPDLSRPRRAVWFGLALLCVGYIVAVARSRSPFLGWL